MTLKRVLFVIHFPVFGGPHNQALRLAHPLLARGWDTVVVLPAEPGNAAERLRAAGVEVVTMPLHRLRASTNPQLLLGLLAGVAPESVRSARSFGSTRSISFKSAASSTLTLQSLLASSMSPSSGNSSIRARPYPSRSSRWDLSDRLRMS